MGSGGDIRIVRFIQKVLVCLVPFDDVAAASADEGAAILGRPIR